MKAQAFCILGLLAMFLIAGCVSSKSPAESSARSVIVGASGVSMEEPDVLLVLQGSQGKQEEPMIVLAHDQASFASLWRQINGFSIPAPALDFSTRVVIGVFLGQRSTGGYGLSFKSAAWQPDGRLGIAVFSSAPKPGAMVTQALTSPFILLNAPKAELDPVITIITD